MATDKDVKQHIQSQFGKHAEGYVTSQTHAKGSELDRLLAIGQPQADWLALDVATGGGHTALKFASHVEHMVSSDLTYKMLSAARNHILSNEASNISFSGADAENLPFMDNTFDLVTCRIAPHHFPNIFRFVQECARVLKTDGILLIQDHVLPDENQAKDYVNAFEKLRDPSHVEGYAQFEWEGLYADAGLTTEHTETLSKTHDLLPWAKRMSCSDEIITRLQVMLVQAPDAVAEWIQPKYPGTDFAQFDNRHIIILGRKNS